MGIVDDTLALIVLAHEFFHALRLPSQVYGIGIVEPNQRLQETLNTMVNMIIDNWNQGINRRYVYSRDADIDLDDLSNFNVPGGLVAAYGDASKALFPLPSQPARVHHLSVDQVDDCAVFRHGRLLQPWAR